LPIHPTLIRPTPMSCPFDMVCPFQWCSGDQTDG
jgi:hypothetical protein